MINSVSEDTFVRNLWNVSANFCISEGIAYSSSICCRFFFAYSSKPFILSKIFFLTINAAPGNCSTKQSLSNIVAGYVDKDTNYTEYEKTIANKHKKLLRFDLEQTTGPSKKVIRELRKISENPEIICRYPDASYYTLRKRIADFYGVPIECVIIGCGSDDLIETISKTFNNAGDKNILPTPTFYRIEDSITKFGAIPLKIKFDEENGFEYAAEMTEKCIEIGKKENAKLVFIVNPNNPTGKIIPLKETLKISNNLKNSIIVVDEAFGEWIDSENSAINLVKNKLADNIIVLRTFSKAYALSGLRIGYCIASAPIAEVLNKLRLTYPLNAIGERLAIAALSDQNYIKDKVNFVKKERKRVEEELKKKDQLVYITSETNMMLVRHKEKDLKNELEKRGVSIEKIETYLEGKNYVRLIIRTRKENDELLKIMMKI